MPLSLECWGRGWALQDCKEIFLPSLPYRKITLAPYSHHAIQLKFAPLIVGVPVEVGMGITNYDYESSNPLSRFVKPNSTETRRGSKDLPVGHTQEGKHDSGLRNVLHNGEEIFIVDDIKHDQIYRITIAPHQEVNSSTLFVRINENTSPTSIDYHPNDEKLSVRVEEIGIVVLILALWMIAIALFVHRWGKIRMLEPYQPDYKAIESGGPISSSPSPTHQSIQTNLLPRPRPPSFKSLPRKSSSLCFTPSMLRTVHIPSTYRMNGPRVDFLPQNAAMKGFYPYSRHAVHRARGRLSSDCCSQKFRSTSDLWRRAQSAENLRISRLNTSPGRSVDDAEETVKVDSVSRKSSSFEGSYRVLRQKSVVSSGWRGTSLDSASIRRSPKSPSSAPWWSYGMGTSFQFPDCGRTTPEIRISPTPPESTHCNSSYNIRGRSAETAHGSNSFSSHTRPPSLQRQEPLDETCYTLPYATLHEEENEGEECQTAPVVHSEEQRRENFTNNSFGDSQESHGSYMSQESKISQQSFDEVRLSLLTQDTKV